MTAEPRYVRSPGLLWRRTFDRVVLLVPGSGDDCLVLPGTGIAVWECFAEPCSVAEAVEGLAAAFGADPEVVARDVVPITEALVAQGALVEAETP